MNEDRQASDTSNSARRDPLAFLERSPIAGFVVITAVSAVVSAAIYWLSIGFFREFPGSASSDVASVTMGALQVAVALGGSVVAIFLAAFALRMQRQQSLRDDLQAQVELLDMISSQTTAFLRPNADLTSRIRAIGGLFEANHQTIWRKLPADPRQPDLGYVASAKPLLEELGAHLEALAGCVRMLHTEAHASVFANAIFQETYAKHVWAIQPGNEVSLASMQTIAIVLERWSQQLRALAAPQRDPAETYGALLQARLLVTSCRTRDGEPFDHLAVRDFLMLGFIVQGGVDANALDSGEEIRPALSELLWLLAGAYSAEAFERGLAEFFSKNPRLSAVLAKLGHFAPQPLDPEMNEYLEKYGEYRPRVRLVDGEFQ